MKNVTMNRKQRSIILLTLVLLMLITTFVPSFAAGPGEKIGTWVQDQAIGIFVGILAVIAIFLLINRKLIGALIVLVFAGFCAWILFSPMEFAMTIKDVIRSWF